MTNKAIGWTLAASSLGMMFLLIGADVKELHSWNDALTTFFIGNMLAHFGNLLLAFAGGKLIPTEPQNQRSSDIQNTKKDDR